MSGTMNDPKKLAAEAMANLRKLSERPAAELFAEMVEMGLINTKGEVAKIIGGTATDVKPISPKLLAR
jgi:hypothetical protein